MDALGGKALSAVRADHKGMSNLIFESGKASEKCHLS